LLFAVAVSLAGCGTVGAGADPAPSGVVVQPRAAADPACNGGLGVSLPEPAAPLGVELQIASTVLRNGSVLIAYNARHSVVIQSLTSRCTADPGFGHDGMATITRSRGWLNVEAVAARRGGGAVVAGLYRNHAAVVEVDRRGAVVRAFGHGGRALFPFCAEPSDVLQERSGQIIVAGGGWIGRGCVGNWAAALFANGRYDGGFGDHGIVPLPTIGADSGVTGLTLVPGGNILIQIGYGNSGCWGYTLRLLQPSGWPVPLFASTFERFWRRLGFEAFAGSVYTDGKGFTLVGTGQRPCWAGGSLHSRSATGLLVHFRDNGSLAEPPTRFASGMHAKVWALQVGRDTVVATVPYADAVRLALTAVRPNGSVDPRFGKRGRVSIRIPWRGQDAGLEAAVEVSKIGAREILVLAADGGHHELRAIEIRR
jgi:hypothetical protein